MNRSRIAGLLAGILVSPVVISAFASVLVLALDRDLDQWARHDAALEMTRSLFVSVDLFRRDNQRVPSKQEGLAGLVPKYIRAVPDDPWGNPFIYLTRGGDWADVVSMGADGEPGGVELATDVSARYGSPGTATPRVLLQSLFAILLIIPGLAYAASFAWPTAAHTLAGIALFWAWAVTATVGPNAGVSVPVAGAFAAIITALTGTVLTIRGLRGGLYCALAGSLCCLIATAAMVG